MRYTDPKTKEVWDAGRYGNAYIFTRDKPVFCQLAIPIELFEKACEAYAPVADATPWEAD